MVERELNHTFMREIIKYVYLGRVAKMLLHDVLFSVVFFHLGDKGKNGKIQIWGTYSAFICPVV